MSIQASFRSFHVKFFVCGDTENDVVTTKTVPVIHSGVVAPKDSHLPTYTLHLQYEVIILNAVGEGKKKKKDMSVYGLHMLTFVTSVVIFNFPTVPECNRKCQEGYREVTHISATSVPDIHQGPANSLYLTLSEHNLLFFFALQFTCSKAMDGDLRGVFQHLMRSYAAWLPQHASSSGFPLDPLQVITHAEQPVVRGSRLTLRDCFSKIFPLSSKSPGQTDCGGHHVLWGIKEEWRPVLGLSDLKSGADCENNFAMVHSWPARWEQKWGRKENST